MFDACFANYSHNDNSIPLAFFFLPVAVAIRFLSEREERMGKEESRKKIEPSRADHHPIPIILIPSCQIHSSLTCHCSFSVAVFEKKTERERERRERETGEG